MKILIYTNCLEGHHLEYIHHLYKRAIKESNSDYVFVIPDEFHSIKYMMDWPMAANVSFVFLTAKETRKCNYNKFFHFIGSQTYSALLLSRIIKKHRPDHTLMMSIDMGIPFLDFLLQNGTKVSCICYRIIPYQWGSMSIIKKAIEWWTYHIVLKKNKYSTIFLLNNHKFVDLYNNVFSTSKYKYLTDPVTTDPAIGENIRGAIGIPLNATMFIHVGVMNKGKGTLNILQALKMLSEQEIENMFFVFAGKIAEDIKETFYDIINDILLSNHIIVYDKFCEYDFFASLYKSCDYVLFPYAPRPNSSGLLGNAALYGKPVITADGGAMGDLVREYHLGFLMPDNSPSSIRKAIIEPKIEDFSPEKYVREHTIDQFCDQVFSAFD